MPPNTAIINIDGTADGAAAFNGDQSLWYQPFNTSGSSNLLEYTIAPGTYGFRVIDPADAAKLYPTLSSNQLSEIYTAWTFNTPWLTDYLVFDSSAATNKTVPQLFDAAFSNTNGTWTFYMNAQAAYTAAVTNAFYDLIRPGLPNGRDGLVFTNSWTFSSAETLIIAVADYGLSDNAGGVSVLISSTTSSYPVLAISETVGEISILWPTNAAGFQLEESASLAPANWNVVTNVPTIDGRNNSLALPMASKAEFFRLHNPCCDR